MRENTVKFKFTNSIVFAEVMRDEKICREFLRLILSNVSDEAVRSHVDVEKVIFAGATAKSVRLDVLFRGGDTWYNIELQVEREKHLPKRVRYYQSMIDTHSLKAGEDYDELKPTYIIFICLYDEYRLDEPIYEARSYISNLNLPFEDGRYTILLNTACSAGKIPGELRPFYDYVRSGILSEDFFVEELHGRVESVNEDEELVRFMTIDEEIRIREKWARQEGREEGLTEGLTEGRRERDLEIARTMKADGLDVNTIAKYTGLSHEEIKKL